MTYKLTLTTCMLAFLTSISAQDPAPSIQEIFVSKYSKKTEAEIGSHDFSRSLYIMNFNESAGKRATSEKSA